MANGALVAAVHVAGRFLRLRHAAGQVIPQRLQPLAQCISSEVLGLLLGDDLVRLPGHANWGRAGAGQLSQAFQRRRDG